MKILFYEWNAFMQKGIEKALQKMKMDYDVLYYQLESREAWENDPAFVQILTEKLAGENANYDVVFSVDYLPLISDVCERLNITYISWVYDSPIHIRDISSMNNDCNRIYFFDRGQAEEYQKMGITTAFYLPLAADCDVFLKGRDHAIQEYEAEISFVGQLYQSDFAYLCSPLDQYQTGYLEGVIHAQQQLYGAFIIPEVVPDTFITCVNQTYERASGGKFQITRPELEYTMACEVTGRERFMALALLSRRYQVDFYSGSVDKRLNNVRYCGYADYYEKMPLIFHNSKINLNISLKTIRTGIPLRVLDILACGGFLLTNYQQEIMEYFEPGVDLVIYEDMEDMVRKAEYYLTHEEERKCIAAHVQQTIREKFSFEDRMKILFRTENMMQRKESGI